MGSGQRLDDPATALPLGGSAPPGARPQIRDLSSYVSRLLAGRLASGGAIEDFEWTGVRAAVMLTDIAGFTSRVERAAGAGPAGLEQLARGFNTYFADLVGVVYGHGGDVLSIAGDAFFSYWPAESDEELADAVLRAAQAGLAIQEGLDMPAPASGQAERFTTRVGISAGDLWVAFAGGVGGRWELIPAGTPLSEVAEAERCASTGAVVLAQTAWERVASRCEGREREAGLVELAMVHAPLSPAPSPALIAPDPPEELLSAFVPLPVRQRQLVADTDWLQEIREVTVVMARVPRLDTLDDQSLALSHEAVRAFQHVMARFEGAAKPLVDNKGVSLSGVFGLPPRAHQDDMQRAIRAAHALREELEAAGVRATIGVATGRAFCGVFGSDMRREYTMHGEVVTVAARLMEASEGDILCTEVTARAARDRAQFDRLEPIAVKGRAEPVSVRRLRTLQLTAAPSGTSMVGREAERKLLADRIGALATDGRPGAVLIEGEAGLGKSRLVEEAERLAEGAGVSVLAAAADAVESSTSYYAWRAAFVQLIGTPGQAGEGAESELLRALAANPVLERLLPLLNSVVPVGIPDNELTRAMPGDVRAENTKALLAAILRRATAAAPTMLVIEDAHWLDSNSWGLVLEVVESVPKLLVVVTTRPMDEASPAELDRLTEGASTDVVRLEGLSPADTHALVAQRLGVEQLPAELARFVEDRVAGHPFFCEQLVQTMREAGIVGVNGATAWVGDLEGVNVPATIQGAVLSRLDRLTVGELLSLKVAAVIGRSFLARTVRDVLPLEGQREAVDGHLATLADLGLTIREDEGPDASYMFRHEITRDVAYELLTLAQRQQLHRAVAEWHERAYAPDELVPHYPRLAHHWSQADDPVKTVACLERAGEQALHSGAFEEALHFLSRALELQEQHALPTDSARQARWEQGLGTAHYFLGDLHEARELLLGAIRRLDRAVPQRAPRVAAALLAATGVQMAHLARPSRYSERRRAEKELLDEAVACYKILGQIYYLEGEPAPILTYLTLAGLNLGEEAGRSPHLARMLIHAATVASLVGLNGLGDRYAERAVEMTEAGGQREAGAYVWSIYALLEIQRGNWRRAREANQRALDRIREVGDFNLEAEVWQTRSALHICEGAFDEAEPAWTHTRDLATRRGNAQALAWSLLDEVETRIGRDELALAVEALDAARVIPIAASDGGTVIEVHYCNAIVWARQGRLHDATRAARQVVDMVAGQNTTGFHWAYFCAGAAEVYFDVLDRGGPYVDAQRDSIRRGAARACKAVRRVARQFGTVRPHRWLLEGMLEWEHGRRQGAFAAWRRAEETADRMDMPFERARARFELARRGGAGPERRAYLDDSAATFERLGARYMLRRAREELEAAA